MHTTRRDEIPDTCPSLPYKVRARRKGDACFRNVRHADTLLGAVDDAHELMECGDYVDVWVWRESGGIRVSERWTLVNSVWQRAEAE